MAALRRVEDVDAAWASAVLAERFPGVAVGALTIGKVIHGTATKAQLAMTYNEAGQRHGLPPTMWLKCGLEAHSTHITLVELYANEAAFYAELAPTLGIERAESFVARTHEGQSVLLLEDLLARRATFQNATMPASPDRAAQVLAWQARLHARYWQDRSLAAKPWLTNGALYAAIDTMMAPATWDRCMALPRAALIPASIKDFTKIREGILHMMRTDAANAQCLVHGDAHLGNVYVTPDAGPGYVDWQCVMHGFWAHDVSDFMTTGMTIEDRRASERDLIAHYVATLAENGVTLSLDEAWLQYRRHALYNLTWTMNLPEWQPEEINAPNTERACAAVVDLDSFAAWD